MAESSSWIAQAGTIPLRDGKICLITSTSGKRWIIPKGLIDPGKTAAEMALQEAWEEAGVVGTLRPEPVGTYRYDKYGGTCHVTVFLMNVTEVADSWPESGQRQREWVSPKEALQRLDDEGLKAILRRALGNEGQHLRDRDAK